MKTTITFLFFLWSFFLGNEVFADCASEFMMALPNKGKLHVGEVIILEGCGESQKVIRGLGTEHPVFLESSEHLVKLEVKDINLGMYEMSQAILVPTEHLEVGKLYHLRIDHLTDRQEKLLIQRNVDTFENEPILWFIEEDVDSEEIPIWKSKPVFIESNSHPTGCGPTMSSSFRLHLEPKRNFYVKVELKNLSDGTVNSYYIPVTETQFISIGHGMCYGPFSYKPKIEYQIRFNPLSIYGHSDESSWSEWISLENPWELAKKEESQFGN